MSFNLSFNEDNQIFQIVEVGKTVMTKPDEDKYKHIGNVNEMAKLFVFVRFMNLFKTMMPNPDYMHNYESVKIAFDDFNSDKLPNTILTITVGRNF